MAEIFLFLFPSRWALSLTGQKQTLSQTPLSSVPTSLHTHTPFCSPSLPIISQRTISFYLSSITPFLFYDRPFHFLLVSFLIIIRTSESCLLARCSTLAAAFIQHAHGCETYFLQTEDLHVLVWLGKCGFVLSRAQYSILNI